jgi:hypothetical protein
MTKIKFLSIFVLISFQTIVIAQADDYKKHRISRNEGDVDFSVLQEKTGDVFLLSESLGGKDKSNLVIRLCTQESLELALIKSALKFRPTLENFSALGFSKENIIVSKSPECISEKKSIVATEIWNVPLGKDLPSSIEIYKSDRISLEIISESIYRYVGTANYIENTNKLIKELKRDKLARGVIFALYDRNINKANKYLRKISALLIKHGIKKSQYFMQAIKREWATCVNYFNDSPRKLINYPSFFIVKLKE